MTAPTDEQVRAFLRLSSVPGAAGDVHVRREPAGFDGVRFAVATVTGRYVLKRYEPAAAEVACRDIAGLRLGGSLGLAPALTVADELGEALGGPCLVYEDPGTDALAGRPLAESEARAWLFLLLTLHHLPSTAAPVASSMSPDLTAWWRRSQPAWEACRRAYSQPTHVPLLNALGRLHVIANVHIEAHRDLWRDIPRRPCHGNPVPANVVRGPSAPVLTEWDGFGLGDPALETGRAAALAALTGELAGARYGMFVEQYLAGVRDLGDVTFEQRLRVCTSVLPLGYCFAVLDVASQLRDKERDFNIEQARRALSWVQQLLGVRVGDPAELLAPLRG